MAARGARAAAGSDPVRIGVLMGIAESDPQAAIVSCRAAGRLRIQAGREESNIRIDYRWGAGDLRSHPRVRTSSWCELGSRT